MAEKSINVNGLKDASHVSRRQMCVETFYQSIFNDLKPRFGGKNWEIFWV